MSALVISPKTTGVAAAGVVGTVLGVASPFIVAAMLGAGTAGSYALAVKIVDAILAGSTIATIVGLLMGGGLGAGVIAAIKWAIKTYGRKKAIA